MQMTTRYTLQQQLTARGYVLVNRYFAEARRQIALLTGRSTEDIDLTKPVVWADFPPSVRGQVERIYQGLYRDLQRLTGASLQSAGVGDSTTPASEPKPLRLAPAPRLELSKRIWNYVGQERDLMELTLTRVLREKTSASDAVHLFAKYLNLPDEMRRYITAEGDAALSQKAMQLLHPGAGVYRDPVKNILRLLKTEINRATKTADWERMQASPYVLGYRIKRSGRHHNSKADNKKTLECELCDRLVGEYPKSFKFTGWHPNCECVVEPIFVRDPEERKRIRQALKANKPYTPQSTIRELPKALQESYHRLNPRNQAVLDEAIKPYRKEQRKTTLNWAKAQLVGTEINHPALGQAIRFTTTGLKEAINQPHKHYDAKLQALRNIKQRILQGEYLGEALDDKGRNIKYHYIKTMIAGEASTIVIKEESGKTQFHGITEAKKTSPFVMENRIYSPTHYKGEHRPLARSTPQSYDNLPKRPSLLERAKARQTARTPEQIADIKQRWELRVKKMKAIDRIEQHFIADKVEFREVKRHSSPQSVDSIISRLSGGDKTKGSCSSLAFAYIGNRCGLDVLDYRGGQSCQLFSRAYTIKPIIRYVGGSIEEHTNDFKATEKLLSQVEIGKEYYFGTGEHAAIIRKDERGLFEYLELQSNKDEENGFQPLTNRALRERFKAQKSHTFYRVKVPNSSFLADVELFRGDMGFRKLLGYLNTAESEQQKGADGSIK